MANDQNRNRNQGKGQQRGRGSPPKPKCPLCNINPLPVGKETCLRCETRLTLEATGTIGKSYRVLVRTCQAGKPKQLPFRYSVEGGKDGWMKETTADDGTKEIIISYSKDKKLARFILPGSEGNLVEVEVPAKPRKERRVTVDVSEPAQPYKIEAKVAPGKFEPSVLVLTSCNGHHVPIQFGYVVDNKDPEFADTSDGSRGKGPIGSAIVKLKSNAIPRRASFFVVGQESNEVTITIPPKPDMFQGKSVSTDELPQYKITGHVTVSDDGYQVFVQTYMDERQMGCRFSYQVEGQPFIHTHTSDGVSEFDVPAGTRRINIPLSNKKRSVTLHIIGAEADISNLELPAKRKKFRPTQPTRGLGFWGNLGRGLRGE